MKLTYMHMNEPCTEIIVEAGKISIINFTEDLLDRAFGANEHPTFSDFEEFLESRCFPRNRFNARQLIRWLGTSGYNPIEVISRYTDGVIFEDNFWIRFDTRGVEVQSFEAIQRKYPQFYS